MVWQRRVRKELVQCSAYTATCLTLTHGSRILLSLSSFTWVVFPHRSTPSRRMNTPREAAVVIARCRGRMRRRKRRSGGRIDEKQRRDFADFGPLTSALSLIFARLRNDSIFSLSRRVLAVSGERRVAWDEVKSRSVALAFFAGKKNNNQQLLSRCLSLAVVEVEARPRGLRRSKRARGE